MLYGNRRENCQSLKLVNILLLILVWPFVTRIQAGEICLVRAMPTAMPAAEPASSQWGSTPSSSNNPQLQGVGYFAQGLSASPGRLQLGPSSDEMRVVYSPQEDAGFVSNGTEGYSAGAIYMNGLDGGEPWTWQMLPEGLIFRSFLAGGREPRFAAQWVHVKDWGWLWDSSLGARIGLVRYGTQNPFAPQGWELDIEGAAFPRLKLDSYRDMISADFRFGFPLTWRRGRWQTKLAFYHLSSHLADEYMLVHPELERINYSRDVLTFAIGFFPRENWRLYAECGWAWYADGGSKPWEFQFGVEYSPLYPNGFRGNPFFAINTRLREEVDYGGNMTVQTGWQWRGRSGQRFRIGLQYFNGMSDAYQFFREFEEQIGAGIWYDF